MDYFCLQWTSLLSFYLVAAPEIYVIQVHSKDKCIVNKKNILCKTCITISPFSGWTPFSGPFENSVEGCCWLDLPSEWKWFTETFGSVYFMLRKFGEVLIAGSDYFISWSFYLSTMFSGSKQKVYMVCHKSIVVINT